MQSQGRTRELPAPSHLTGTVAEHEYAMHIGRGHHVTSGVEEKQRHILARLAKKREIERLRHKGAPHKAPHNIMESR